MKKNLLLIVLFIAIIFFGRILPHPYNFTPLIAVTLLSSYSLSNKFLAIMIPLVGFWISDLFMNNYIYAGYFADFTVFNSGMIWTYGAIVLVALMGSSFLNKISTGKVVLASLIWIYNFLSYFKFWSMGIKSNVCKDFNRTSSMLFVGVTILRYLING